MRKCPLILVYVFLMSCAVHAWGADFRMVPSFSAKEEYNDNIFLSAVNRIHDRITTLSPGLEMMHTSERMATDLSIHYDFLDYAANSSLNDTNYLYSGTASGRVSPLFSFSMQAAYAKYANPTLTSVPEYNGIVTVTSPLYQTTASASAEYQFAERDTATFAYKYTKVYYDNPQYLPNTSHDANAGFVYDFGRSRLKGRMNAGYSYYYFPGSRIDSAKITIGFSRDIDETWSILMDAGVRHTLSQFTVQQFVPSTAQATEVTVNKGGWGTVGNVSLIYKGERTNGNLTYAHDISPSPGWNGVAERYSMTLSAQRSLTYELSVVLLLGYYSLRSDPSQFSINANKQNTSVVNTSLYYAFSRDTRVDASFNNSWIENPVSGTVARRQSVYLRLSMQYPLFE